MEIVAFRTKSGDLGAGRLNKELNRIEKCVTIVTIPSPTGQLQINVVPFLSPLSEEYPDLSLEDVYVYAKVNEQFKNIYIQATSGIAAPTSEDMNKIISLNSFRK